MRLNALLILIPLAIGACSDQGLRDLRSSSAGPDEFAVSPARALEAPADYKTLPTPTPGKSNRSDRSALNEGVTAFGGRPQAETGGIPTSDGALVRHASRLGVSGGIREDLAEDDAKFRKRKARFTRIRIARVDRYNQAYRRQILNAETEAARWRRSGARTPSAPPPLGR